MTEPGSATPVIPQGPDMAEARVLLRAVALRWRAEDWWLRAVETWPGPVAHEIRAFGDILEAGDAGGALLQLRDTVETLLKFLALTLGCDLLAHGTPDDNDAIRRTLFRKPLTIGDWWSALRGFAERIRANRGAYFTAEFTSAVLTLSVEAALREFLSFRNDEIGHGAFRRDPREVAAITDRVVFHPRGGATGIFAALSDLTWPRLELLTGDNWIALNGADSVRDWHDHSASIRDDGSPVLPVAAVFADQRLNLAPFIAGRVCAWCQHRDVFLFDSVHDRKNGGRFDFLDYVQGHKIRCHDSSLGSALAETKQENFSTRSGLDHGTVDAEAIAALERAASDTRYIRPSHLYDALLDQLQAFPSGLTWIQAPAHVGKSIFARAIADPLAESKDPLPVDAFGVAGVFVKREWHARLAFLENLVLDTLMHGLSIAPAQRHRLPRLEASAVNKPLAFVTLLMTALDLSRKDKLLLVIDGVDELDPSEEGLAFADFLPTSAELPDGVHLVILSRRPNDEDCPDWIRLRLAPRLDMKSTVLGFALGDPRYRTMLHEYTRRSLGREPEGEIFQLLLSKADNRFLYLSFLLEQMAATGGEIDVLREDPHGTQLFGHFLTHFKQIFGWKRLAEEAELLLSALAAEELAHNWAIGSGLVEDNRGPVLVDYVKFQGMALRTLADQIDRLRPDGEPEGVLLYAVYRLKNIIGVYRGADGESMLRIGIDGMIEVMATHPSWAERIKRMHAHAAMRTADNAAELLTSTVADLRMQLTSWSRNMSSALGHAVLSESPNILSRVRDTDDIIKAAVELSGYATQTGNHATGFHAANMAISLLEHRRRTRKTQSLIIQDRAHLVNSMLNRGGALQSAGMMRAAVDDFKVAEQLQQEVNNESGASNTLEGFHLLATLYMNQGVAWQDMGYPSASIPLFDESVRLQRGLQELMGTAFPLDWVNSLSAVLSNRGNSYSLLENAPAAISDHSESIQMRQKLREIMGEQLQHRWSEDLANVLMNRASAFEKDGDLHLAIMDCNESIKLRQSLKEVLGSDFPKPWQELLATSFMIRGDVRDSAGETLLAFADYDTAIEMGRRLWQDMGSGMPFSWLNGLAEYFVHRGIAYNHVGDVREAINDFGRAIKMRETIRSMMGDTFPPSWGFGLAGALQNRASAFAVQRETNDALHDFDTAIKVRNEMCQLLGDECLLSELGNLATAFIDRGVIRRRTGDLSRAVTDFDQGLDQLRRISQFGREESQKKSQLLLVAALVNRGVACFKLGQFKGSAADYDEAVELSNTLSQQKRGSTKLTVDEIVIKAHLGRALVRDALGDRDGAVADRTIAQALAGGSEVAINWDDTQTIRPDPVVQPLPPPLLPGKISAINEDALRDLVNSTHDTEELKPFLAHRPTFVGHFAQQGPGDSFVVALVFAGTDRRPGLVEYLVSPRAICPLVPFVPFEALSAVIESSLDDDGMIALAAMALAGPWAAIPCRLLTSDSDIPWLSERSFRPETVTVRPPGFVRFGTTIRVEGTWLRGRTLETGAITIKADGAADLGREAVMAESLPVTMWAYDGPIRIAK